MIAARRELLSVRPEGIPAELKARPQWVNWRLEERNGDFTKVPYTPWSHEKASSTDLLTWETFGNALTALQTGRYDGIGFVFSSGDPYCGVDLDGCRNPETGEVDAWAQKIITDLTDTLKSRPRDAVCT